jgi:hypothetical protein
MTGTRVTFSLLSNLFRVSFPGVKRPGHEVVHIPPSSAVVKIVWSLTSTPLVFLYGVDRDDITFPFRH